MVWKKYNSSIKKFEYSHFPIWNFVYFFLKTIFFRFLR